ncbi:anthranilate synthase component I [Luminiphilus sp.]|nr:anthranilate synthase component I [Luminiphilus sp.]
MDQQTFDRWVGQGYNRIPVAKTILADVETPLSAYMKLAAGSYSFLFESVQGGEKWGRYSIIGLPARRRIRVQGKRVTLERDGFAPKIFDSEDPLAEVEAQHAKFNSAPVEGLPVFHGGLVGYFGYDVVRYVETKLELHDQRDALNTPDILLLVAEEVLVFDNLAGTLTMVVTANAEEPDAHSAALTRLTALERQLPQPGPMLEPISLEGADLQSIEAAARHHTDRDQFMGWVETIRKSILDGDVMQVVPSQRMTVDFKSAPISLYRALRNLNPSPYMYFLDMGDFQIVGSSPEILVRAEQGEVTVRPIAGTRKRGFNEQEDEALAKELLADPKEMAEHLMLIDLGRNDLGRIAQPGSVEVTESMLIERYSHVMHIVSNVKGQAQPDLTAMDALRATLPAGTLSGAPKVMAMQIIDRLESVKRGVYGGAVGYISWAGDMDTAIAIRTAVIKDQEAHVQAGAGIVADSVPADEWEETMNKARGMLRAVAMVSPL